MTVPTTASYVTPRPAGNGVTTVFNFGFKVFDAADIVSGLVDSGGNYTAKTNGVDYVVSGIDQNVGGQVTYVVPPAAGLFVDIRSQTAETQPTAFTNQGKYLAQSVEDAIDRCVREIQDLARKTYTFGIHGPDTELTPWASLPGPTARANTGLIFDGSGQPGIGIVPTTALTQALFNAFLATSNLPSLMIYPQTTAESVAGVTPVNLLIPSHDKTGGILLIERYGTNATPGTTDMLPAFQAADLVGTQIGGGTISGQQQVYLLSGTWAHTAPVSIDFHNSLISYTTGSGAILYSTTNALILTVDGSDRIAIRNINIKGVATSHGSQSGLSIGHAGANTPVDIENVGIFNCGLTGLSLEFTVASSFRNIYVQGCGGSGIVSASNQGGANKFYNVASVANVSAGWDLGGAGSDTYYGISAEQNAYNFVCESGCIGHIAYGVHSEIGAIQSLWFKSGSNKNRFDFESIGSSEPLPLNAGGAQNAWSGQYSVSGVVKNLVHARAIQHVSSVAVAKVYSASNTLYATNAIPANNAGLQVLSQAVTPFNTGNELLIRAWGISSIHTTGTMIIALFGSGSSAAIYATSMPATGDIAYPWSIEFPAVAGTQNVQQTFTVNVGSSTASDGVTFGGANNVLYFDGIGIGGISIEEYYPSSG